MPRRRAALVLTLLLTATGATLAASGPARLVLQPVDVERLIEEDLRSADADPAAPWRVALTRPVDLGPDRHGAWDVLPGGDRRWQLRIESPGARWLVLGFGRFRLPAGALLRVRGITAGTALGPFGADDVRSHGRLWLPPIAGDVAILELVWPAALGNRRPELRLDAVSHGYRDPWGGAEGGPESEAAAGSCNVDVNCPLGDPWQHVKRGVVHLLIDGSTTCTGSLVNTTAHDCRPYLLTAAHCVNTAEEAASVLVRFHYEHPLCEAGETDGGETLSGATLVATHGGSDFALLELDQAPPRELEPYYNGWNRSAKAPQQSWTLHHPRGGVKKISYDADPAVDGGPTGWGPDHWRILGWDEGTTEAGSSGAPLFDATAHIVGQLHGGTASCESGTWDEFGKLHSAWTGAGVPQGRLLDWLDPLGSGATSVDGLDGAVCAPRAAATGPARPLPRPRPAERPHRGH
jgi:hypothetical protein